MSRWNDLASESLVRPYRGRKDLSLSAPTSGPLGYVPLVIHQTRFEAF